MFDVRFSLTRFSDSRNRRHVSIFASSGRMRLDDEWAESVVVSRKFVATES